MGLFSSRPEEPTEWAGLPSEPLSEKSPAEQLADAAASADLLAFQGSSSIESILIPVPLPVDTAPEGGVDAGGGDPGGSTGSD
ncbi:hypothetical protein ACFM35_04125 [Microbacterium sp. P01]|uniref:hypothetical protein n=1 Tax=unclassified Microbacterium TaxID=2609290 RepID=UPI0036713AAB